MRYPVSGLARDIKGARQPYFPEREICSLTRGGRSCAMQRFLARGDGGLGAGINNDGLARARVIMGGGAGNSADVRRGCTGNIDECDEMGS